MTRRANWVEKGKSSQHVEMSKPVGEDRFHVEDRLPPDPRADWMSVQRAPYDAEHRPPLEATGGSRRMRLSMKDHEEGQKSAFTMEVTCPHCEHQTELPLGPQHRVAGRADMHCRKCARLSSHEIRNADAFFDAHTDKMHEQRDVWKKVPSTAFVTVRRPSAGGTWIWTFYSGSGEPKEYFSRDSVEHRLTTEFGLSWAQANHVLQSAGLSPGYKIYVQRYVKIASAIDEQEMRRTGAPMPIPFQAGNRVRVAGRSAIFLRYSSAGFAMVAFPGIGDTEVPIVELEVEETGSSPAAVGFDEFEMMGDPTVGGDPAEELMEMGTMEEVADDLAIVQDEISHLMEHEETDGESEEVDALEDASEAIDDAVDAIDEFVMEEGSELESDFDLDDEDEDEEFELGREHADEEFDDEHDHPTAMRVSAESSVDERIANLYRIINDPATDPTTLQTAQSKLSQLRQVKERRAGSNVQEKITSLQQLINDPNVDPQTRQKAQTQLVQLKRMQSGNGVALASRDLTAFWGKTDEELEVMVRPKHQVAKPDKPTVTEKSDLFPKREDSKKVEIGKLTDESEPAEKEANLAAQRRVHTHYTHSHDLKRALQVNRTDLSIADIRQLLSFYVNTGKIASDEASDLGTWFVGKPRLLTAWKGEWRPPGLTEKDKGKKEKDKAPKMALAAQDLDRTALLDKGTGIFQPASYQGREVLVIAIDNTGAHATVQDENGSQFEVEVAKLSPVSTGPYSGNPR